MNKRNETFVPLRLKRRQSQLVNTAQPAPGLVERCLAGQQPRALTQRWLKRHPLPDDWRGQRDMIDRFE
ncbi:MAG: hypothetical protein FJ189_06335 [Gammaproteobacteria bacterium]|nr:hypothetical protein [Gammaproteobacteria bacterium]